MHSIGRCGVGGRAGAAAGLLALSLAATAQITSSEAAVDLVARSGGAGVGWLVGVERSPYRGGGLRHDLLPVYLYEGERFFLRSDRLGLKLSAAGNLAVDVFLRRRVEGLPQDRVPEQLRGVTPRDGGVDLGLNGRLRLGHVQVHAAVTQNVGHEPRGQELTLGTHTDWLAGRWTLRPALALTWRSARSNDFYYGVPVQEATPERPAYRPGAGVDVSAAIFAGYQLTEGWRPLGGVGATRRAGTVRASPIVEPGIRAEGFLGAVYSLEADEVRWQRADSPTWVRVLYGRAAEERCNMTLIMTLRCTSINADTPTAIAGLTVGKTLLEGLHGWPLDFVGYAGLIYHRDRPFQRDTAELNLFLKAYYRGFPWSGRVLTRFGIGWGISIADPVPYAEVAEQSARGRRTSRVLNYIDPSLDISLGDAIGKREWKQTFVGLGITHRSGMFAHSRLLGGVVGGSNYMMLYVEHPF